MNAFRLDGRLALVTGGSRGIGFAIARAMTDAGARAILVSRPGAELDAAAAGMNAAAAPFDLQQTDGIPGWYDEVVARHGRPDILINAAGMTRRAPAESVAPEDWDAVLALNLTAVFRVSQCFARHLIAAGAGGRVTEVAGCCAEVAGGDTTGACGGGAVGCAGRDGGAAVDLAGGVTGASTTGAVSAAVTGASASSGASASISGTTGAAGTGVSTAAAISGASAGISGSAAMSGFDGGAATTGFSSTGGVTMGGA
jgi:NAD(P)-dependent dehydrogenase (short-subunit alcohol dehydrogenase family)